MKPETSRGIWWILGQIWFGVAFPSLFPYLFHLCLLVQYSTPLLLLLSRLSNLFTKGMFYVLSTVVVWCGMV